MKIILAKSAGYCFGVRRALKMAQDAAKTKTVRTYGPLIHNKLALEDLREAGVRETNELKCEEGEILVLRAHGVPPSVYEALKNVDYLDCVCPYVKKIHKIVKKNYDAGKKIIITGDANHPEIIGINGFANNEAQIIKTLNDINSLELNTNNNYCLVAQTTFNVSVFNEITKKLNSDDFSKYNIEINDTICAETKKRRAEIEQISKTADYCIALGDKQSANARELFEICKRNCENSFFIECISELELNNFSLGAKIGITAGASTPPRIIKEAVDTMSELTANELTFEEMLEDSIVTLHTGDIVKGTVIRVTDGETYVNLGYKADGIIEKDELSGEPGFNPEEAYKPGDEIEVYVLKINDGDGNVQLSVKKLQARKNLEEIEKAFNEKTPIKGKVQKLVKGGLTALINGVNVFVPSSQISNRYVEDLKPFVGKEFDFNILEFGPNQNKNKTRLVAGRKELAKKEEEERKERIFADMEIGKKYSGTVRRIVDFGAFIDLGGIDGLAHISELSWGRVKKVSDVLKEGDKIEASVLDFDRDKGKISLTLRDVSSNPWSNAEEKYPIGKTVKGSVARLAPFGAFIELEDGVDGLVHISQISQKHIAKPEDILETGQIVNVKITDVAPETKRISLSIKDADPDGYEPGDDSTEISESEQIESGRTASEQTVSEQTESENLYE
jgi:4-hydroxy-3-methylbut-2-enyl diphosphate reductase